MAADLRESDRHLRGSTLLVAGRMIALVLNFAVQVLIVRTLTKSDFGAFAYGLSFVAIATNLNILGMAKTLGKLFAQHDEREDQAGLAGITLTALLALLGFGLFIVLAVYASQSILATHVVQDQRSLEAVIWLILLVPLQALDSVFQSTAAVFIGARAIFFRRHLAGPLLKLLSILLVILLGEDLYTLTTLYVIATGLGVALYVSLLTKAFRNNGVIASIRQRKINWPGWSLFALAIPLLTTDFVIALETNFAILVLENRYGTESVAALRAILPLVGLVMIITEGLKFLYLPLASRLYERNDMSGLADHYWRSFRWIVVFSFPLAALMVLFAPAITELLFGARYAESAILLTVMVPFQYLAATLGLNHYTMTALGRGRLMLSFNFLALGATVLIALLLIPVMGALGAALATATSLLVHNSLQLAGLRNTGILQFDLKSIGLLVQTSSALALLWLAQNYFALGFNAMFPLLIGSVLAIFRLNRSTIDLQTTFPELARLPLARWFLGVSQG